MSTEIILHTTPKSELRDLVAEAVKEQLSTFFDKKEPDNRMLSRKEVSEMLGISLPTLHTWTKEGVIPGVRIGNTVRYRSGEIQAAMKDIRSIKYSRYKG